MIRDIATDAYIDGVVEHHQIRDELGLTITEARQHPDTLEVFDELVDNVATNPELYTAYAAVINLAPQAKARKEAVEKVRDIELAILGSMVDSELITDSAYSRGRVALRADSKEVYKRAKSFILLFKSVIPEEVSTKPRKTPVRTSKPVIAEEVTEVTEAPVVVVIPVSTTSKATPLPYYERLQAEQAKVAAAEPEVLTREEVHNNIVFANRFLGEVTLIAAKQSAEDGRPGARIPFIAKKAAEQSGFPLDDVKEALRNYQKAKDLHVVGHDNGIRRLSDTPLADSTSEPTKPEAVESPNKVNENLTEEELVKLEEICVMLIRREARQGVKFKALWRDDPSLEPMARKLISRLVNLDLAERHQSRQNPDPVLRFKSVDIWRSFRTDLKNQLEAVANNSLQASE